MRPPANSAASPAQSPATRPDGPAGMTLAQLRRAIASRTVSATDVVRAMLDRIEAHNLALNAFREVYADDALRRAGEIDARLSRGESGGALAGVPIAIKDNIACTLGTTAAGSRFLEHYRSPFDATAVSRLLGEGAVILGRTNCDEFAMGSSTEHCAFGPVRNPHAPDRVPGGSSGGSASAVAAWLCPAALGSDTGGSVRQPAACCGVVGVKPSYGRVSRWGLVAFASSLDQIGPITHCVEDAAILLDVISGRDPLDATCADLAPTRAVAALAQPLDGPWRVGVARQHRSPENHPAITGALDRAIECCRRAGASIVEIDLPLTDHGIATYYILAAAEASSNLARYDGIRYGRRAAPQPGEALTDLYERSRSEGFGPEVRRRIMLGTYVLSAGYADQFYLRALKARRLIRDEFSRAFHACDVILGPTAPSPAWRLGEKSDPLSMYLGDVYTVNANIAGLAALSIPAGWADVDGSRLPIGVQLQAPAMEEERLLHAAGVLEALLGDRSR